MSGPLPPPPSGPGDPPAWQAPGDPAWQVPGDPAWQVPGAAPYATTYATFGQRAGAAILDGLMITGAILAIFVLAAVVGFVLGFAHEVLGAVVGGLLAFGGYIGVLVLGLFWEAGPYGQTPGKHVVGIRVIDTSGATISKAMSAARYVSKMLSGLPCYVGYLWPLWDAERRTWHDMIVNTRVVTAAERAPSLLAVVLAPLRGRAEPGQPSS